MSQCGTNRHRHSADCHRRIPRAASDLRLGADGRQGCGPRVSTGAGVAIWKRHEHEALRGISAFKTSAGANARRQAASAADREIEEEAARRQQENKAVQAHLDQQWSRLVANDPDVLFATLTEAFEDNGASARPDPGNCARDACAGASLGDFCPWCP